MNPWLLTLVIFLGVIFFISVLIAAAGIISFRISIRRNGFVGRSINKKYMKNLKLYNVDYSFWDDKETEQIYIESAGLRLTGFLLRPLKPSGKVAILAHGFFQCHKDTAPYAEMFLKNGYNVLIPDQRAHGESEGNTIGMGYLDRADFIKWIDATVEIFGSDCQIVLFGISMGGAAVCNTSGESLPKNVRCVVSDSAFDSVYNEFTHILYTKIGILARPVVGIVNPFTKWLGGYSLKEASVISSVARTYLPILFIHGAKDWFVPPYMSHNLFHAHKPEGREIFIMPGAKHTRSYATDPKTYEEKVMKFVGNYID